jgi:transposase-like protein
MAKKRKKYTQEFRDSAVKLILEQGYQVAEAARNLGINPTTQFNILIRLRRDAFSCERYRIDGFYAESIQ